MKLISATLLFFCGLLAAADTRNFQPDVTVYLDNGAHYDVWNAGFEVGAGYRGPLFTYTIPASVLPLRVGITNYFIPLDRIASVSFEPRLVERDPRQGRFMGNRQGMNQMQACSTARMRLTDGASITGIVNIGGGVSGPCPLPVPALRAALQYTVSALGTPQSRNFSIGETVQEIVINGDSCTVAFMNFNRVQRTTFNDCHWLPSQALSVQGASITAPAPVIFNGAAVSISPTKILEVRPPAAGSNPYSFLMATGQTETGQLSSALTLVGRDESGGLVYLPLTGRSGFSNDRESHPSRVVFNPSGRIVKLTADTAGAVTIDNQVRLMAAKKVPQEIWLSGGSHQVELVPADKRFSPKVVELAMSGSGPDSVMLQALTGLTAPVKVDGAKPTAPPAALDEGITGVVTVKVPIDEKGKVNGEIKIEPQLHPQIVASIRQAIRLVWKIEPATKDGEPVPGVLEMKLEFPKDFERPRQ
jgi:hypothetical protein